MSDEQAEHITEADRQQTTGAETAADPDTDEVGPVSGDSLPDAPEAPDSSEPAAQDGSGELSEEEIAEIERAREIRLDPDNRPEGAEVDNTQRDFDETKAMFTDSEEYSSQEERFPPG